MSIDFSKLPTGFHNEERRFGAEQRAKEENNRLAEITKRSNEFYGFIAPSDMEFRSLEFLRRHMVEEFEAMSRLSVIADAEYSQEFVDYLLFKLAQGFQK